MCKEKIKHGKEREKKKKRKCTQKGGRKNGSLIFILSVGDKLGNFKTYIQYNKLFDET